MRNLKTALVISMITLGLGISGAAEAKAKFYFRVCAELQPTPGVDYVNAMDTIPSLQIRDRGTFYANPKKALPLLNNCNNPQMIAIEDSGSGNYGDWKVNDGQQQNNTSILFSPLKISWGTNRVSSTQTYVNKSGTCSPASISANWVVTSISDGWRNFNIIGSASGLIKIKVDVSRGYPICTAVLN